MRGLCPCKREASRALPTSSNTILRRALKVLHVDGVHYKSEIDEFISTRVFSDGGKKTTYRVADGHYDPDTLSRARLTTEQSVPTLRFVPDGKGGGVYTDGKSAQHASTPVKPPSTPSGAALSRLSQHVSGSPAHAAVSGDVEVLTARTEMRREQLAQLEASDATLRARIAELESQAQRSWGTYRSGGFSPQYRWEAIKQCPPDVVFALTGMPNAECFEAMHGFLNSCHMLDDVTFASTSDLRASIAAATEVESDGDGASAAEAPAAGVGAGVPAAPAGVAGAAPPAVRAGGVSTGKRGRGMDAPTQLFPVDRSERKGGRPRILGTLDVLLLVFFLLRTGITFVLAGWTFGIASSTVSRVFTAVIRALDAFFQKEFPPIPLLRATLLTPPYISRALRGADVGTYVADGTEFKQMKPSALDIQRDVSAFLFLCVCTIWFLPDSSPMNGVAGLVGIQALSFCKGQCHGPRCWLFHSHLGSVWRVDFR
jgi:Helix-turn-helix of DDE superfamily endonuclease